MRRLDLEDIPGILLLAAALLGALIACAGCPHDTVKSATAQARQEISIAQTANADASTKAADAKKNIEAARTILKNIIATTQATTQQLIDAINSAVPDLDAAEADTVGIEVDTATIEGSLKKTTPALDKADTAADKQQSIIDSMKKFHGVEIGAFAIIGLSIAAGIYFGNLRVGAAGAAGGLIVLLIALNLGEIGHIARWIGGLFALGFAAFVAYEICDHGGLSPALFKAAHDKAVAEFEKLKSTSAIAVSAGAQGQ